jgi:hypothetical protein
VIELAITIMTITGFLSMLAVTAAITVGHYTGRRPNTGVLEVMILSAIVIPAAIAIVSLPLYNIALNDWPGSAYVLPPQFVILAAAFVGGILGFKSGEIWNQGEGSCFRCLASLVSVLTILSLVVVLIL